MTSFLRFAGGHDGRDATLCWSVPRWSGNLWGRGFVGCDARRGAWRFAEVTQESSKFLRVRGKPGVR